MKQTVAFFLICFLPGICWAEPYNDKQSSEITMSAVDVLKMTGAMIDRGDIDNADQILNSLPEFNNIALDIERQFLLGRAAAAHKEYDKAIAIYRRILDAHPDLARVRFELAVCYMQTKQWRRADYQLRRAMAGDNLPDNAKDAMNYLRYVVRQNKNWNIYFNTGIAPDNNINTSAGGEECVNTIFGVLCRQLPKPEKAVGFNIMTGGDYEFRLTDRWRWKSDAHVYTNIYNKHDFDDLYLSAGTGPRYVWQRGDIWLSALASRRWYGWDAYNWSAGGRVDANYDFTRKTTGHLALRVTENTFDEFGDILDGQTYDASLRITHSFDASKYIILRWGLARETAKDDIYSHWRPSAGLGFGIELPAGFNLYLDASAYWQRYDGRRWIVKHGAFEQVAENSFTHRYAASISNNKLALWNFVPTLTVSYTRRDSNIWQREFDKLGLEFSVQQRF